MVSSSTPIEIVLRSEPEELRERRGTLRLKACPFCGGPLEMGGYADLDEFERSWNARASGPAAR